MIDLLYWLLNDYIDFIIDRLTAVALQVLAESRDGTSDLFQMFQVSTSALSRAAIWLSNQQDNTTGAFREVKNIYNRRFRVRN